MYVSNRNKCNSNIVCYRSWQPSSCDKGFCPSNNPRFSPFKASDLSLDTLVEYDNKCFISSGNPIRREFLRLWVSVPEGSSVVALDKSGKVVGAGFRRPCVQENSHQVGPLYADDVNIAGALMQRLCSGIEGKDVTINIWLVKPSLYENFYLY